jgi:hypothetical protein
VDGAAAISNHFVMSAFLRCAALLRNGQPCDRTVAEGSEFCVHHTELLATVDAETLRHGRTPKPRTAKKPTLRVVTEHAEGDVTPTTVVANANADPATVRPSFAAAAAENVDQLTASLLEAAGSAVKPVWLTVECEACGERSRIEAPVPDVRARLAAIELLLREGLGRAPQAEETAAPQLPPNVEAIRTMDWVEMQHLFAAIYVDEIAAVCRNGADALVREKLGALSEEQRHVLREALAESVIA